MARLRSTPGAPNAQDTGPSITQTRQTTTRATRSQTRSVSVDPRSVQPPRTTRSVSKQGNTESDGDAPSNSRQNARRNGRKQAAAPLDPVPEDIEAVEIEPLNDSIEEEVEHALEDVVPDELVLVKSLSGSMTPSQMTNMTTFSQGELKALDSDNILSNLLDLDEQANRLLALIIPKDATDMILQSNLEQLYEPGSRLSKQLRTRSKVFTSVQDGNFGNQTYIQPDLILRSLFNVEHKDQVPERSWRPDAILYEANLANLVNQVCQIAPNDNGILDLLSTLDNNFPSLFMSSFPEPGELATAGSSSLFEETYRIGLELRTQLAIMNVLWKQSTTYQEATESLCEVFLNKDAKEEQLDTLSFELFSRGWDGLPLEIDSISGAVVERIDLLRSPFDAVEKGRIDPATARRQMEKMFPWGIFQGNLLGWAQVRMVEIDEELSFSGGTEAVIGVVRALEREIEQRRDYPDAPQEERDEAEEEFRQVIEQDGQLVLRTAAQDDTDVEAAPPAEADIESAPAPTSNVESTGSLSASGLGIKTWTKDGMSFLRKNKAGSKKGGSIPPSEPQPDESVLSPIDESRHTPVIPPEDDYQDVDNIVPDEMQAPQDVQAEEELPMDEPQVVDALMSPRKRKLAAIYDKIPANKENRGQAQPRSLLDPQDNGARIEFDDGIPSQSQPEPVRFRKPNHMLPPSQRVTVDTSPQRRPGEEPDIDDPSEDEGFERDTRQPTTKRLRSGEAGLSRPRGALPISTGPSLPTTGSHRPPSVESAEPSRPRLETAPARSRPSQHRPSHTTTRSRPSIAASPRKNPGQSIPPYVPLTAPGEDAGPVLTAAENLQQASRLSKLRARTATVKEPRMRKPWSEEEGGTLITMIAEHGCSWAMLKSIDADDANMLDGRLQLDLRDKARNMKVDYLMSGMALPKNFDLILLDKKAIDKLERHGLPYEQRRIRSRKGVANGDDDEVEEVEDDV